MRVVWWRTMLCLSLAAGAWAGQPPRAAGSVLRYATFLGTTNQDAIIGVKADAEGMIYVVGYTDSAELATTPGAYQPASGGGRDIFVAKFNPALSGPESLVYLTYFGGSGADTPTAMTVDDQGWVSVTGSTTSIDFPIAGEAPQTAAAGGEDAFVMRLNPNLAPEYAVVLSTHLGGTEQDVGLAIDVDAAGAIYVAGVTKSEDWPLAGVPVQEARWGTQDGFVAKVDPNRLAPASLVYSTYLGGNGIEQCRAIAAGPEGLIYVAGTTQSAAETFPVLGNSFQPTFRGHADIFLTVLDLARPGWDAVRYSTFLGGASVDEVRKIAVAPGGVLLTGYTLSTDFPITPDAYQGEALGNGDVFVTLLDPRQEGQAGLVYSTYFGGHSSEVAYDILGDAEKNIYLTGYTLSGDLPVTPDGFQPNFSGGVDVFCAQLSLAMPPAQALVYGSFAGGGGINVGYGISVSANGSIYVAGRSQDQRFPVTESALQPAHAGGFSDGFILALGKQP